VVPWTVLGGALDSAGWCLGQCWLVPWTVLAGPLDKGVLGGFLE
jgi:hypothetical protein